MKKFLLSALALVTVAVLAITGTIAFLQDEKSDVNVMTTGSVYIEQHEYQRATNDDGTFKTDTIDNRTSYVLEAFKQAKPLLPVTTMDANGNPYNHGAGDWDGTTVRMSQVDSYGGAQVLSNSNVQDKFVTVENTGKTDAYVRTLVAFELGDLDGSKFDDIIGVSSRSTTTANDFDQPWFKNTVGVIEIDGNHYVLVEYVYHGAKTSSGMKHENGVLPAGDTTYPSLCQVYMKANATNEDCDKIDGNNNGTYDILVLSQAVQTTGFADAETALNAGFGDITTTNHPWATSATSVEVDSADELAQALAAGNDVKLTADVAIDDTVTVVGTSTLDLNGKKLTINGEGREHAIDNYGTLTVKGGTIEVANTNGASTIRNNGTLTVEDATLDGAPFGGDANVGWPSYVVNNYGVATISNTTVVGDHGGVACNEGSKTTLNNVSVTVGSSSITSNGVIVYAGADLTINGGSYSLNANSHVSCSTVRVFEGATYTTDGTATFSKPVWNQNN